jgi:hypothetical protein
MKLEESSKIEDGEWFEPDVGDNMELPKDERGAIRCRVLKGRALKKATRSALARSKAKSIKGILKRITSAEDDRRTAVVLENVTGLRNWNLKVIDKATTPPTVTWQPIERIDALIAFMLDHWPNATEGAGFVDQIYEFIVGESSMDEELLGESSSPPASA